MITIRTILCPFDGSDFSRRALDHAIALGRWYKAGITLLNVHPGGPETIGIEGSAPSGPLAAGERKRIVSWLADMGSPARAEGVSVEARVVEGRPAAEIVGAAKDLSAELIVMGTHGRSGFDRLVLGSVTEKVLRRAPCPVLTVTDRTASVDRTGRPPFESIVCPIDFSASSLRAIEYALSLAQEAYGRLTILHALEPYPADEETMLARFDLGRYRHAEEEQARARLRDVLPEDARRWCKPENEVTRGKAYRVILEAAERRAADLIIMGIHGRNALDLALFGSTTHHVVRAAHCPVLAIRTGPPA
jgi:nucleotide-binding universal stress UspA family protein